MKLRNQMFLILALLSILAGPVGAQVQQVVIHTTGISCGFCAVASEMNFKRMPGIDQVTISLSKETVTLTYKAGAAFAPQQIRQILEPLKVGVVQMHVSARGHVQQQGGRQVFTAGKDQFVLADAAKTDATAPNTPISIEGIVDDRSIPMELKVLNFRLIRP